MRINDTDDNKNDFDNHNGNIDNNNTSKGYNNANNDSDYEVMMIILLMKIILPAIAVLIY